MLFNRIILLFILWTACLEINAQVSGYTPASDRYFKADEYSKMIRESAAKTLAENNVPQSVFESGYPEYREIVERISRPLIMRKFRWLENGYSTKPSPGSPAFLKRKDAYAKELHRAVRDALNDNPEFLRTITRVDETDRILLFDSYITVMSSGKLTVVETIRIYNGNGGSQSGNDEIKRGIRRSFPTKYLTTQGLISNVGFRLKEVMCNGKEELFELRNAKNGIDVYIGNSLEMLDKGIFTYRITYETDRQLIFHSNKDELYWNVNGTGWGFSCDKATCSIRFPEQSSIIESDCYTGTQGSAADNCLSAIISSGEINFQTTTRLEPYEGLTVAAAIQKGVLAEPGKFKQIVNLAGDNAILPALFIFSIIFFLVHFFHWKKLGKDPAKGVIFPQFAPPAGMSPADCGYLVKKYYEPHLFAASLVDHAVNKRVNINVTKEGTIFKSTTYSFEQPPGLNRQAEADQQRYDWYGYDIESLYGEKATTGEFNPQLASMYSSLHSKLKERMLIQKGSNNSFRGLFSLNDQYIGIGLLVLFLVAFGSIYYLTKHQSKTLIIYSIILYLICMFIQLVFMKIINAYTTEGRKLADHILGFRMYLETAEENKFNMLNPPGMTLQLFEKYLPYAIALQCENEWSEKFSGIIQQAAEAGYQPSYYNSSLGRHTGYAGMASSLSSGLSGAIASASTPPGSSSGGSGGGGSSGGGGGGGGGGGW